MASDMWYVKKKNDGEDVHIGLQMFDMKNKFIPCVIKHSRLKRPPCWVDAWL